MTTTIEPTDLDVDLDLPVVDPWVHSQPITQPEPPKPEPVDDGLTDAVRRMVAELDAKFGGADVGSVGKAIKAMRPDPTKPSPWGSQGQAGKAVKAYRAKHGIVVDPPAAKTPARTKAPKPTRTATVRPPVPPVVRAEPTPVVQAPVPTPPAVVQAEPVPQPAEPVRTSPVRRPVVWPVMLLAAPAFVAIWGGWVGLGGLTGFGKVNLLPGIGTGFTIDSAITLPIGVETYGAYALYVWLSGRVSGRTLAFARTSAITSLLVGALGQVAYHLLVAAGVKSAPWWITTLVACLPVAVLGMGAALAHLVREEG